MNSMTAEMSRKSLIEEAVTELGLKEIRVVTW